MVSTPRDRITGSTRQEPTPSSHTPRSHNQAPPRQFQEPFDRRDSRPHRRSRSSAYRSDNSLNVAIVVSLLLHLVALKIALPPTDYSAIDTQSVMNVELLPNLPPISEERREPQRLAQQESPRPKQIVSQPSQPNEPNLAAPTETNYLSERDQAVAKEQIKRGDPLAGPVVAPKSRSSREPAPPAAAAAAQNPPAKTSSAKPAPQAAEQPPSNQRQSDQPPSNQQQPRSPQSPPPGSAPRLKTLALDQGTLLSKFVAPAGAANERQDPDQAPGGAVSATADNLSKNANSQLLTTSPLTSTQGYTPFSRPMGSGAQFMGRFGSSDYLPNLPDGDITLLNTKADQFAVFVRRVATRVFSELRSAGWENLSAGEIRRIEGFATVKAELSLDGRLLSVTTINASGSPRFDSTLTEATNRGASDPHPPPAARAPNGNIIFIFQAKSWSEPAINRRTGTPTERRWLLLAAGLG